MTRSEKGYLKKYIRFNGGNKNIKMGNLFPGSAYMYVAFHTFMALYIALASSV